ncbi:RHS repeat domain-containing protein [Apibacter adventoris]|uniref:RHS repeat domain-containing protein n=1 Tax=Apibacter adventoris TaxID=1679466 RepID=UPI001C86A202|nr:RHS repeat-associated core domain-containing protein [Apibacter adventoris]
MQYYYHADHLGSSSYITNLDAQIVQHVEYVPFGEVFIEERNQSWNTPYLFNGKELDEETGLYYYGARYYNPRESVWLSSDPLAEKYPNISPYAYTFQNPINYTDPTGMVPEDSAGDPPKRSWFGRNISQPIGSFFKRLFNPFPEMKPKSSGSETNRTGTVEVGEIEQTHDPETIAIWDREDNYVGGDPFSGLAEVTTQGIQWLGEQITGSDVSEETANNIQLGTTLLTTISSKGKSLPKLISLVKKDSKLLKLSKETFKGNVVLRKEANDLIDQLSKGNMNPGIGTKSIGKGIFEARSRGGARVYFRNGSDGIEIVGYSSKANQQQVINRILEAY